MLIATYWPLGILVAAGTFPVIGLSKQFGANYSVVSRRMQDQQGDLATLAEEAASGIRVTKAFGRGPWLTSRFMDSAQLVRGSQLDMVQLLGRFWSLLMLIPNLTMALVVLLGTLAVVHGAMTLGALVAFVALLVLLQWPVIDIGWILAMAEESATASMRLIEVFQTVPAIADPLTPIPLIKPRGRLAFESVWFQFDDADTPTLRNVNLTIEPGETVAIVGATGSGKSVLTALPSRLHDVTSGRITLDGVDIRDMSLDRAATRRRDRVRGPGAVLDERSGEPRPRPPRCDRRRHRSRSRAGAGRRLSPTSRGGSTRGSASRVCRCPAGSDSGLRSRAPWSRNRRCSSSTTRCPRWTSTPKPSSSDRSPRCSARPPAWSWCTGRRPWRWPTGSRCCRTAHSPPSAPTPS